MMPSVMDERHEEIRSESISGDHSEKPVMQQLGSLIPCSKHLVRNNGTDLSECLALSLRKSFLHVDAISPSRSSLWPTLRELILNQNAQ